MDDARQPVSHPAGCPGRAQLVVDGPYRYVRHPMYLTLLWGTLALLLDVTTPCEPSG
ncbi:MAG: hypothetical protein HZY76_22485 [Anaerolineae bacterium]|nr:MAG: hypothetical protein HZY76_22485 [Anaerolineae bacterium]